MKQKSIDGYKKIIELTKTLITKEFTNTVLAIVAQTIQQKNKTKRKNGNLIDHMDLCDQLHTSMPMSILLPLVASAPTVAAQLSWLEE